VRQGMDRDREGRVKPSTYVGCVTPDGKCARHEVPLERFYKTDGSMGDTMDCPECYKEHPNYDIDRDFIMMHSKESKEHQLTYQDAITLLKHEYLEQRAMFVAYDDCDAMHASDALSEAISWLERAKPTNVLPEEVAIDLAIKKVESVGGVKLKWVDGYFEEIEE
jgi:hypothetical protein